MSTIRAGTTDYTVLSVMDRLYVTYLTPPDDQFAQVALGQDVDDTQTVIILGSFTIPEDEGLLRQGSLLELDQELVRIVTYDATLNQVTVVRGEYGTPQVAHTPPLLCNLNPPYTRAAVYEAVADNIITLYPKLFTSANAYLSTVGAGVFPINDQLAVQVLSAWPDGWTGHSNIQATIIDFHQLAGGRAIITENGDAGSLWFRYRRRMKKATSELDKLVDLGVDERWVNIIMVGAAADLLVGRDIPAAQTEWVKSVLEAENIRVGTRLSIAGGLRQYRTLLITDASREMKAEYKPKVHMRSIGSAT